MAADNLLPANLLALLKKVDTPTVCNAIEVAEGKRGFDAFTKGTMVSTAPQAPAVVGFARTARIAGAQPPLEDREAVRARRLDYFRAMADGPRPAVAVVEDCDFPNCIGAWWGEVHFTVHRGLGLAGAITSGLARDLGELDDSFPIIAGGIGPSHAFVHVTEIGCAATIFGLTIREGDLVHADRHGALVVPPAVLPDLAAAIRTLIESERLILDPANQPDFDIVALETAWRAFENART